jgi:hypothetical protein
MKNFRPYALVTVLATALVFSACSDDDSDNPMTPSTTTANVRVIHASYDAPAVDVAVNSNTAISNLAYGMSSGYAELMSGETNVMVMPTGASDPVVINADLTLEADAEYTVFATGALANISPVVALDDRMIDNNMARIRFVHLSPDAPAVDIKLNDGNGAVVFENVAFGDVKDYVAVAGGTYTFAVTATGSASEVVIYDPITVMNGYVYSVTAIGTLAEDTYDFTARVFIDNSMDSVTGSDYVDLTAYGTSNVMVVHASPDAPGVDLLVDDQVAGTNLLFPANTDYLSVSGGMRNVKVNVTGTSTTVINADLTLEKDTHYTVFASDVVASIQPLVLTDDLTAPAAGNAHVRFVHLSPDAPAVDITTTTGAVVFGNKSFREHTAFTPLAANTYDLQVRVAGTETVALELPGIVLEDGNIYTVFAKGFLGGTGDQALSAQIIVNYGMASTSNSAVLATNTSIRK